MDKHEIIKKLNREIAELKKTEVSCFELGSKTEEMKFTNRIMGLQVAQNWVRQLDEPQKVKVPAFVAEWIEWCKQHNWQLTAMATTANAEYFESHSEPSGLHEWILENYATFLIAIATDNYEVEEQLYIMPLPYVELSVHYCIDKDGKVVFRQGNAQKFTEAELDDYFPDIKHFAVKV